MFIPSSFHSFVLHFFFFLLPFINIYYTSSFFRPVLLWSNAAYFSCHFLLFRLSRILCLNLNFYSLKICLNLQVLKVAANLDLSKAFFKPYLLDANQSMNPHLSHFRFHPSYVCDFRLLIRHLINQ